MWRLESLQILEVFLDCGRKKEYPRREPTQMRRKTSKKRTAELSHVLPFEQRSYFLIQPLNHEHDFIPSNVYVLFHTIRDF